MVDEYQDTNFRNTLAEKLAINKRNLCVVGDDAQVYTLSRRANQTIKGCGLEVGANYSLTKILLCSPTSCNKEQLKSVLVKGSQ